MNLEEAWEAARDFIFIEGERDDPLERGTIALRNLALAAFDLGTRTWVGSAAHLAEVRQRIEQLGQEATG